MRSALLGALACAMFATRAEGHGVGHQADYGRMQRHAQRLSESCKRKGRTLDDACITDPEVTGGPYVWDQAPVRKDITEGWPGVPFVLNITVMNSTTCTEIAGAAVEIWHCTADGLYSHFIEASAGNGTDTDDTTFLRGIQYTDDNGVASFTTIWPGWYLPRATHIHVRVHFDITETDEGYSGGTVAHVGQLFFDDSIVETIAVTYPYTTNNDARTALADDQVVSEQGGYYGLTTVTEMYEGEGYTAGCIGTVTVGIDSTEASGGAAGSSSASSGSAPSGSAPSGTGTMTGGGMGGARPSAATSAPKTAAPVPPTMAPTVAPVTSAPATDAPSTDAPSTDAPASSSSTTPSAPLPSEPVNPPSAPQQPPVAPQVPSTPPTQQQQQQPQSPPSSPSTQPSSPQSAPSAPCTPQQSQPSTPQGFRGNF